MTDAEVAAMARGGEAAVVRRITKHSPTKASGTLTDKKAAPPRITASEMEQIQRTGRVPRRISERLEKAAYSEPSPAPSTTKKDSPKVDP